MKTEQSTLIDQLTDSTKKMMSAVEKYRALPAEALNFKSAPGSWSILECLEHLNLYGDFYLKEIETRIIEADKKQGKQFKRGLLGNYFANSMLPKNGKINKMKTFKDKDPANSSLPLTTIDRFLKQQDRMLDLLKSARAVDLNKVKTSITIPVIKLKLGDTFRFVINQNLRHMIQIEGIEKVLKTQKDLDK